MRKILVLLAVLVLGAVMTTVAFAGGKANVFATFSVEQLGQGVWGGGPLFADGTMGGNVAFSAVNGQLIFHDRPIFWLEDDPEPGLITRCFELHVIKNTLNIPTDPFEDFCFVSPVTGTPVPVDLDGNCVDDALFRLTLAN